MAKADEQLATWGFRRLVLVALLGTVTASVSAAPHVPRIDLTNHDFDNGRIASIAGEWDVFWRELLTPADFLAGQEIDVDGTIQKPATWNDWEYQGEPVGGLGYATFRTTVELPEDMTHGALRVPNASTAYRLWINSRLVASSGIPGTSRDATTPRYRMQTARFTAPDARLDMVLQVANFHHRRGGMWKPIEIGRVEDIVSKETVETAYDLLLIGSFFAMALYNLLLYHSGGRRSRAPLWLAVLFGVLTVRIAMMGQMMITRILPAFPWGVQLRIEYSTAMLALLALTQTLRECYPQVFRRRFTAAVWGFVALNILVILGAPVLVYSRVVLYAVYSMIAILFYEVARLLVAAVGGMRDAWLGIGGTAITLFITLGETIHYQELILSRDFAPLGFLITLATGDSINQSDSYLISTGLNLLLTFLVANLLAIKGSRSIYALAGHVSAPTAVAVAGAVSGGSTDAPPSAGGAYEATSVPGGETPNALNGPAAAGSIAETYGLTNREAEIVALAAEGASNKEIAARLFISVATVKVHMTHILQKTGAANRTMLVRDYLLGPDGTRGPDGGAPR